MTHSEKIEYMGIATRVAGYGFDEERLDMLVSIYELVVEKKGGANLKDVLEVKDGVIKRADIRHRSELLDKVSEKSQESKKS